MNGLMLNLILRTGILFAGAENTGAPSLPPAVALLFQNDSSSTSIPEFLMVPLGIFENGHWTREGLGDPARGNPMVEREAPVAENSDYISHAMGQVFYGACRSEITFVPSEPAKFWCIDSPYFAMKGKASGSVLSSAKEDGPRLQVMASCPQRRTEPETVENPDAAAEVPHKNLFEMMSKAMRVPEKALARQKATAPEAFSDSIRRLTGHERWLRVAEKLASGMKYTEDHSLKRYLEAQGFSKEDMDRWEASAMSGTTQDRAAERKNEKMTRSIVKYIDEYDRAQRAKDPANTPFEPGLYEPPHIETLIRLELAPGRKGLWCHITRSYPKDHRPKEDDFGYSVWQENYFALVEVRGGKSCSVLWEKPQIAEPFQDLSCSLEGICDADGDGWAEVVTAESAHEYRAYKLLAPSSDKRYREVCSMVGAL